MPKSLKISFDNQNQSLTFAILSKFGKLAKFIMFMAMKA